MLDPHRLCLRTLDIVRTNLHRSCLKMMRKMTIQQSLRRWTGALTSLTVFLLWVHRKLIVTLFPLKSQCSSQVEASKQEGGAPTDHLALQIVESFTILCHPYVNKKIAIRSFPSSSLISSEFFLLSLSFFFLGPVQYVLYFLSTCFAVWLLLLVVAPQQAQAAADGLAFIFRWTITASIHFWRTITLRNWSESQDSSTGHGSSAEQTVDFLYKPR